MYNTYGVNDYSGMLKHIKFHKRSMQEFLNFQSIIQQPKHWNKDLSVCPNDSKTNRITLRVSVLHI